jgi:hypothetical protein
MASEPAREPRPDPRHRGSPAQDTDDETRAVSRLESGDIVVAVPGEMGQLRKTTRRRRDRARAGDIGALRLVAIATLTPLVIVMVIVVWLVWLR